MLIVWTLANFYRRFINCVVTLCLSLSWFCGVEKCWKERLPSFSTLISLSRGSAAPCHDENKKEVDRRRESRRIEEKEKRIASETWRLVRGAAPQKGRWLWHRTCLTLGTPKLQCQLFYFTSPEFELTMVSCTSSRFVHATNSQGHLTWGTEGRLFACHYTA